MATRTLTFVIPGQCEALNPESRGQRTVSRPWVPDGAARLRNDEAPYAESLNQ